MKIRKWWKKTTDRQKFLLALIAFGLFIRLYDLGAPWKTHDHYNFGGVWTTAYAQCLKQTPLSISKGVPHWNCWIDKPEYYRAHEPTVLFALWAWTDIFGDHEWSYRLFFWFFSSLNVGLVYLIARRASKNYDTGLLAAAFHASLLGGMYFGTHPDFISEFTITFVLVAAYAATCGQFVWACFAAVVAGVTAWPGYIMLATLWVDAAFRRSRRDLLIGSAALAGGLVMAVGTMMWLQQTSDIAEFFIRKLARPEYVKTHERGLLYPIRFLRNVVSSLSRLMSPALAALAGLAVLHAARERQRIPLRTAWLAGGTGVIYALVGHEYFMVHVFLYQFMLPGFSLALAFWLAGFGRAKKIEIGRSAGLERQLFIYAGLFLAAFYPYGIYKSGVVHDATNSLLLIGLSLFLISLVVKRRGLSHRAAAVFLACSALANASQMINYRNEADTERSFCEKARAIFAKTGHPVVANDIQPGVEPSDAKMMHYCRNVPVVYGK